MREYIANACGGRGAASLDLWKSDAGDHYMGVCYHFLHKESAESETWAISCMEIAGSHTGERLAEFFDSVMKDWYIIISLYLTLLIISGTWILMRLSSIMLRISATCTRFAPCMEAKLTYI